MNNSIVAAHELTFMVTIIYFLIGFISASVWLVYKPEWAGDTNLDNSFVLVLYTALWPTLVAALLGIILRIILDSYVRWLRTKSNRHSNRRVSNTEAHHS